MRKFDVENRKYWRVGGYLSPPQTKTHLWEAPLFSVGRGWLDPLPVLDLFSL